MGFVKKKKSDQMNFVIFFLVEKENLRDLVEKLTREPNFIIFEETGLYSSRKPPQKQIRQSNLEGP